VTTSIKFRAGDDGLVVVVGEKEGKGYRLIPEEPPKTVQSGRVSKGKGVLDAAKGRRNAERGRDSSMNMMQPRWGSDDMAKRVIEEWLPLGELNENARREMGFIRVPKISNLHTWLARRPTSIARASTLASILPNIETTMTKFNELLGFDMTNKQPYRLLYLVNPNREDIRNVVKPIFGKDPKDMTVVDPMAGGGAIPLESLRMGFNSIAIDYNPVAYIVLKATLEYPARYGNGLYEDVRKEANALLEYSKSELSKYYAPDAYNYIFARGFKCPNSDCKGLIPIIHGPKLRVSGPYIKFHFNKIDRTFKVSITEKETEYKKLRCPYCGRPFTREEMFREWTNKHKQILDFALKVRPELRECENKLLQAHIPLVKQTKEGFLPCNDEDNAKFVEACVDLAEQIDELRPYIPAVTIPKENEVFLPLRNYDIVYWYELFNPRQLLVLAKLLRYVKGRMLQLTSQESEYGSAIALYLAFGMDKLFNFNNITTTWDDSTGTIRELMDHYSRTRRVNLGLEYCEMPPTPEDPRKSLGWVFEPDVEKLTATHGGVCPVLKQLCEWLHGLGDRVEIYMADARELSTLLGQGIADVVNVDPPYFGQHYYGDLSEFFWQTLRLELEPAIDEGYLFNRDRNRGKIECWVPGWSPMLATVPRSGEIIVRRSRKRKGYANLANTKEWYTEQMWKFFVESLRVLREDGVLVVWYTHSDPEAWEAILSGLYSSDFSISKMWIVQTEMAQRRVALAGSAFFTSMALVARKGGGRIIVGERLPKDLFGNQQVEENISKSVDDALQSANISGASDTETFIMALAGAIAGATKIRNPSIETIHITKQDVLNKEASVEEEIAKERFHALSRFFRDSLYPIALYIGTSRILESELTKVGLSQDRTELVISSDDYTRAYLAFWVSTRYSEESNVNYDFSEKICKVIGITVDGLHNYGLLNKVEKNIYQVLFGREVTDAVMNRVEILDRTAAGQAMYLFKLIADSPIKDDPERCARQVLTIRPASRQVIATALFLLRTAKEDELRKASISPLTKPYVEKVLESLYSR